MYFFAIDSLHGSFQRISPMKQTNLTNFIEAFLYYRFFEGVIYPHDVWQESDLFRSLLSQLFGTRKSGGTK